MYNAYLFADDLSFKAVASQSKIITDPLNLYAANYSVDRNGASCMRSSTIGTTTPEKSTWWKVDLGGTLNIYSINILFKNYDNYGMYHVYSTCIHVESFYCTQVER